MSEDTHPPAHRPWGSPDPAPFERGDIVWLHLLDSPTHLTLTLHIGEVLSERATVVCIRVGCRHVHCPHDAIRRCNLGRAA
jgi:hypothetical protein